MSNSQFLFSAVLSDLCDFFFFAIVKLVGSATAEFKVFAQTLLEKAKCKLHWNAHGEKRIIVRMTLVINKGRHFK